MLLLVKKEFENLYPKDQSQNLKQNAYAKIERNRIIYKTRNLHCPTVQFLSIYCQPQTIDSYIPPNNKRRHTIFQCIWNMFQDKQYSRP